MRPFVAGFFLSLSFLKISIFTQGEGGEKAGGETLMCKRSIDWYIGCISHTPNWGTLPPGSQACALTVHRTGDLAVHRPAPSPLNHTSQGFSFTLCDVCKVHPCGDMYQCFIPFYDQMMFYCSTFCLPVHQIMYMWVLPTFWLLWIMLLWTSVYEFLCWHMFSILIKVRSYQDWVTDFKNDWEL